MKKNFFVSTPIYYSSGNPHIGHAYTTMLADIIARYKRERGFDVFFSTGMDEHGTKIQRYAEKEEKDPREFVDEISEKFIRLCKELNASEHRFIRTTDKEEHWPGVQKMWKAISHDLYKKKYKGLYCFGCEVFVSEKDLVDGKCPAHDKEPEEVEEENWFFRLSNYAERVAKAIERDDFHVLPSSRKNEILSFIKEGVEDISVSRSVEKLSWGIPVPDDDTQRIYVWVDALSNYLSVLGYGRDEENFNKFWPADVHCVGKDILRFHAVIWPAMLLSAGLPLPKTLIAHGYITSEGKKMSKTLGNVVEPFSLIEKYGVDAVRYFFFAELPLFGDGDFSERRFKERYNSDLADGLGNLVLRVSSLIKNGVAEEGASPEWREKVQETENSFYEKMDEFRFGEALGVVWSLIHHTDGYIEREKPWEKRENSKEVVANLLCVLLSISDMLAPFIPSSAEKVRRIAEGGEKEVLFPKI